jgi:hypothetical protein
MGREPAYTSADALVDLGDKPDEIEIERLKKYYPTYQIVHRTQLLQGMFDGSSNEELVLGKMMAKGLDTSITKQAKGGHGKWVTAKVRKTVIRLLYLRHRLDEGMTRRQANQQLVKRFKFSSAKDGGQSIIRKDTHSVVLDGCTTL